MKILITGGAGFIASHVADAYIKRGHRVVIVDNMAHGFKGNINPRAKFYCADIRDLAKMRDIVRREQPQIINHHAAIAEVVVSMREPSKTIDVNVQGTINLLLVGGENKIQKFIFASTGGAIYGAGPHYPVSEKTIPHPESPYGLSKLLGEQAIEYYARMHNYQYLIFRYPNVYGPRQDPHGEAGVVAIFTQILSAGQQPTIFGDGSKTRDYVYVRDIVAANLTALRRGRNITINLGRGREISDQKVYDTISAHFPGACAKKPKYAAVRPGEVLRSCLNAARAKKLLAWRSNYTFYRGVADYIKWCRNE